MYAQPGNPIKCTTTEGQTQALSQHSFSHNIVPTNE
jgi:hypothetical protein